MKVTLGNIIESKEVLSKLANLDLPIKTAYAFTRLVKKLEDEFVDIETMRTDLVKKYGTEEENGIIRVDPQAEGYGKFIEEYSEFLDTEVEIQSFPVEINLDKVNVQLKPIEVKLLEKFVDFVGLPLENEA